MGKFDQYTAHEMKYSKNRARAHFVDIDNK